MKLKLKQSNSISKHFILPQIKQIYPHRYTPRSKLINQSLPKIPQSYIASNLSIVNHRAYRQPSQRELLRQKIKSGYHKKMHLVSPTPMTEETFTSNEMEQANITTNFKKQIEKNLVFIKKERENRKKTALYKNSRYNTPRHATLENQSKKNHARDGSKCITEEDDVFTKLNQIIIKSQSKVNHLEEEPRQISFSSYIAKDKAKRYGERSKDSPNRQILTEGDAKDSKTRPDSLDGDRLKHGGNYQEWRKLSFEMEEQKKISYKESSYQNEAERVQNIRSKNQLSLQKYIEGKSYLGKLIKYRDSSALLSHPK